MKNQNRKWTEIFRRGMAFLLVMVMLMGMPVYATDDIAEPTTQTVVQEELAPAVPASLEADEPEEDPEPSVPVEEPAEPECSAPVEEPTEPETGVPVEEPTEPEIGASAEEPTEPEIGAPAEEPTEPEIDAPAEEPVEEMKIQQVVIADTAALAAYEDYGDFTAKTEFSTEYDYWWENMDGASAKSKATHTAVPVEYSGVVLGNVPASKTTSNCTDYWNYDNGGETYGREQGFDDCTSVCIWDWWKDGNYVNYSTNTGGGNWIRYYDIGTDLVTGKSVDVKVTIVAYEMGRNWLARIGLTSDNLGTTPESGYTEKANWVEDNIPGVCVQDIAWVTLRYDFYEGGTNNPIAVKGSTSYYDIDGYQGVHLHNGNKGIITADNCTLQYDSNGRTSQGTNWAANAYGSGPYLYANYGGEIQTGAYKTKNAFTELFEVTKGQPLYRTFNFEAAGAESSGGVTDYYNGCGAIYHDGAPVSAGNASVTKKVNGVSSNTSYTFTATMKAGGHNIVFPLSVRDDSDVTMSSDYKTATFKLKNGETKVLEGLPNGAVLYVKESTAPNITGYTFTGVTNSVSGTDSTNVTIVTGQTKNITYTNSYTRDYGNLTLKKSVEGVTTGATPEFTFTVKDAEGKTHTVKLNKGNNYTATLKNLPTGTATITEATAPTVNGHTFAGVSNGVNSTYTRTVNITKNGTASVTYTNTYTRDRGNLTLKKSVVGITTGATPEFTFTVKDADGKTYTVKLNKGNNYTATLKNLPTGTATITEATAPAVDGHTFTGVSNGANNTYTRTVDITKNGTASVTYTNTYTRDRGNLTLKKSVVGITNGATPEFTFTVKDADGKTYTVKLNKGNNYTATLKDLPTGNATITEATAPAVTHHDFVGVNNGLTASYTRTISVTKGTTATVTYTNTYARQKGNVNITKTVDSPSFVDKNREYQFKAVLMDGNTKLWEETFTLKHGQTKSYKDLPTGAVLTVTETDYTADNIVTTVNNKSVTVGKGTTLTIAYTNTRKTGNAEITKTVVSPSSVDFDRAYEFKAVLMDGTTTLWEETFTLKHGQTKTYKNLPTGAVLTVTETDYSGNFITTTVTSNGKVTIGSGNTKKIAFTNTRDTAEVSLKKTVKGGVVDTAKEFEFTATLRDGGKFVAFKDGTTAKTFNLKHDETITFKDLPVGAELVIIEGDYEDYITDNNSGDGVTATYVIKSGANDVIIFENTLKNSAVEVKKIIENEVNPNKTFNFTATLDFAGKQVAFPASAEGKGITFSADRMSATFTLGNNQSVTFDGLPVGTVLKVVEEGSSDYTTVNTDGTGVNAEKVVALEKTTVTYTNTRKTGTVKVSKEVIGSTADTDVAFTFTAHLYDGNNQVAFPASVGKIAGITLKDDNKTITFTLKHGESLEISGLYAGTTLKVVEAVPDNYIAQPESEETTVAPDKIKDIDITNLRKLADVDVKKIVAGHVIHDDVPFTFTATLFDGETQIAFPGETTVGSKTFTLKHNELESFKDLYVGSTLKIVETENVNFTTENTHGEGFNATYTVKEMLNDTIVYTNTVKTGSVKVTKTVAGGIIDKEQAFEFTATLSFRGEPIAFPDGDETKTFTLKHDEEMIFTDLPIGTVLKAVETEHEFYTTTYTGNDATVAEPVVSVVDTAEKTLAYTNTVKETELTITKTITGNMGDREKAFSFTVTMVDKYGNAVKFEYEGQEVNSATFALAHDESVTLTGIPVGAIVTVDEENEDYIATATLNEEELRVTYKGEMEFTVEDTEADAVVVNNDNTIPVPVGVVLDSLPYVVILAVVIAGGIFLFLRKRKVAED